MKEGMLGKRASRHAARAIYCLVAAFTLTFFPPEHPWKYIFFGLVAAAMASIMLTMLISVRYGDSGSPRDDELSR